LKIIIADNAGFCFGVKRAVKMTEDELDKSSNNIYSYGPLIHNPQLVSKLEERGLKTIKEFSNIDEGRIIVRSHGIPKSTESSIIHNNLDLVDCTCPYVKSVHKRVEEFYHKGYNIIIIGKDTHPEVIGINGYCNNEAIIVNSLEEVESLPLLDKVCVVSQTTNTLEKFSKISGAIRDKMTNVEIFNTICNATTVRQNSTEEVSKLVDAMVVIGGYESSNTLKLCEISRRHCKNVFHIETIRDLSLQEVSKFNTIGITAGASTPDWIIEEAVKAMDNLNDKEMTTDMEEKELTEETTDTEMTNNEDHNETTEDTKESQDTAETSHDDTTSETIEEADEDKEEAAEVVSEEEAPASMNDEEMSMDMMAAIESSFTRIHKGEVLKGTILFVTDTEVMVNINYKSDGIINRDELSKDPDAKPKDLYKEGEIIDVYVVRVDDGDGNVVLSTKRVDDMKGWEVLEEHFNNKDIVEARVLNAVKGGLTVVVNDINGFIPASHVSAQYVTDLNQFKGQTFKVKIIDFDIQKRRVILSRKEVEREELDIKRKEVWAKLEEGQLLEGVVQRLTDFGAFVDIGGVDGLIHISDLSWNRIKHPSEVVKVGEKVEVRVLALDEDRNRISLGLKQTIEEPWEKFQKNVEVGSIVEGTVVNLLDFGAFVRLNDGVDGLLHVSQISKEHINKPSDVLKNGEKIMVKIIDVNEPERRISLSMKDLEEEEVEEKQAPVVEDTEVTIGDILDSKDTIEE
jgi:4-hydroxy-3-methylbut-2-enyl diphosphate reductase